MAHKAERRREKIEARAERLHNELALDGDRRAIVAALLWQRREALEEAAALCGARHRRYRDQVAALSASGGPGTDEEATRVRWEVAAREALALSGDIAALKSRVARRGRKK